MAHLAVWELGWVSGAPCLDSGLPEPQASSCVPTPPFSTDATPEDTVHPALDADQGVTSTLWRQLGPEAPGPSAGDFASSSPDRPSAFQETGPRTPDLEASSAPGEAQWEPTAKGSPVPTPPWIYDPTYLLACPAHGCELAEPEGP